MSRRRVRDVIGRGTADMLGAALPKERATLGGAAALIRLTPPRGGPRQGWHHVLLAERDPGSSKPLGHAHRA